MKKYLFVLVLLFVLIFVACGDDSEDSGNDVPGPTPVASPTPGPTAVTSPTPTPLLGKSWTLAEIAKEPRIGGSGNNVTCMGTRFKPCICANDVPNTIRYRPSVVECNGNAAVILYDNLRNSFSVVLRNSQNSDREPKPGSGFGGCSYELAHSDGAPNRCSAYKTQDKINLPNGIVHCMGDDGYSSPVKDATRITIKIQNINNSSNDPLVRACLFGGNKPLN